jgi:hypothetical protein
VTRQWDLNAIFGLAAPRFRSTNSISGLDAQSSAMPKSRFGNSPTSGRSKWTSRDIPTETAPTLARSSSKAGNSAPRSPEGRRPAEHADADPAGCPSANPRMSTIGRVRRSRPVQNSPTKRRPSTAHQSRLPPQSRVYPKHRSCSASPHPKLSAKSKGSSAISSPLARRTLSRSARARQSHPARSEATARSPRRRHRDSASNHRP